jgi:hypothetical protein
VLLIDPRALLGIEAGGRAVDGLEREALDQFVECFDLICEQWETSVRERFLSVAT